MMASKGMDLGIQAGDLRLRHRHSYFTMKSGNETNVDIPRLLMVSNDAGGFICEFDDQGNPVMPRKTVRGFAKSIMNVFLPAGYPDSVTHDYTAYQIYDSLQAFSSTIAGLLSSRAVLQGFGVGDSASSATAAVLLTVLQEATGRLATILFAHRYGRAIEPECKFYRFLADIVNDSALFLDILSPALPTYPKVLALCGAGILRALCGVSGGAAKASLSAHFAINGNLAELNAKDGSQETVISLLGMLAGSLFVQFVNGKFAVWAWMVILVGIHLWTNYKAVSSVQMHTLNKQRLNIVAEAYLTDRVILSPSQVAAREGILTQIKAKTPVRFANPSDIRLTKEIDLKKLNLYTYSIVTRWDNKPITPVIFMTEECTNEGMLRAWIEASYNIEIDEHDRFWTALDDSGWDLYSNALETGPSIRLV